MTLSTTTNTGTEGISSERYREVMRHYPSGVAAVASLDPETGAPCGLIVGTLASLSLDPALITFSIDRASATWPKISRSGKFTVSLLAEGQQHVARALSGRREDKFAGLEWSLSPQRTPQIDGATGWIHATINREVDGGDHVLVIADVVGMSASGGGRPMIFHGGRLGGVAEPDPGLSDLLRP
ncbi:flavin reductase family protein [Arthrobacter sp. Sa2BUA2]|uniref:Flavin reductase family protein n=1 Tax=Arthrobacter pullicola TaxID=2762224 RepID=A0ABR8YKL3_9MICC|nr:flavin reductase family protein [Arthrobacter pullicola]MBD8044767.1 flavin reductase family protein [Arthrobacter pullicola]